MWPSQNIRTLSRKVTLHDIMSTFHSAEFVEILTANCLALRLIVAYDSILDDHLEEKNPKFLLKMMYVK